MIFKPREFVECPGAQTCISCQNGCLRCDSPPRHISRECEICESCVTDAAAKSGPFLNPPPMGNQIPCSTRVSSSGQI